MLCACAARRYLLQKWLDFRATLYQAGIQEGFQWIDGSFVENIEQVSGRPPNDIDVVTFFYVPDGYTGAALYQRNPRLFDSEFVKDRCAMDAYFVQLNHARTEEIIEQSILVQYLIPYAYGTVERLLTSGFEPRP